MSSLKRRLVQLSPPVLLRLRARLRGRAYEPPVGKVALGDLRRVRPVSSEWGFERGGAIDRYYIEQFLQSNAQFITGRVLEIGDDSYTRRFGSAGVERVDVLHVDDTAPLATFVGDLADGSFLPSSAFDCVVLTQTLHLIFDFRAALETINRILKPGGTLLLTSPGISNLDPDEWGATWHYSFSVHALRRMFDEYFDAESIDVRSFGNVLTASAFLFGLGRTELTGAELDHLDEVYPVVNTARVVRRGER